MSLGTQEALELARQLVERDLDGAAREAALASLGKIDGVTDELDRVSVATLRRAGQAIYRGEHSLARSIWLQGGKFAQVLNRLDQQNAQDLEQVDYEADFARVLDAILEAGEAAFKRAWPFLLVAVGLG